MKKSIFLSAFILILCSCSTSVNHETIKKTEESISINKSDLKGKLSYISKTETGYAVNTKNLNDLKENIILDDKDYKYRSTFSNDGKRLAFFYNDLETLKTGLGIIDIDGKNYQKFQNIGIVLNSKIKWSSDDSKIIFTNGNLNILKNETITTFDKNSISDVFAADWILNGEKIIYVKRNNIGSSNVNTDICVINSDGTNKKIIGNYKGDINYLNYSKKENKVVFSYNSNLNIIDINTYKISPLTFLEESTKYKKYVLPIWSYDGTKILYTNIDLLNGNTSIGIIDSTGKNEKTLTTLDEKAFNPKWSYNDKFIYYIAGKDHEKDVSKNIDIHYKKIFLTDYNGFYKSEITQVINDINSFDYSEK